MKSVQAHLKELTSPFTVILRSNSTNSAYWRQIQKQILTEKIKLKLQISTTIPYTQQLFYTLTFDSVYQDRVKLLFKVGMFQICRFDKFVTGYISTINIFNMKNGMFNNLNYI